MSKFLVLLSHVGHDDKKLHLFSALFILSRKLIVFITLRNESKFVVVVVEGVFCEYRSLPGTKNFAPGALEFLSTSTILGFLFR